MVDGSGLENRHTRKGIGGSNPSLSATLSEVQRNSAVVPSKYAKHINFSQYSLDKPDWRERTSQDGLASTCRFFSREPMRSPVSSRVSGECNAITSLGFSHSELTLSAHWNPRGALPLGTFSVTDPAYECAQSGSACEASLFQVTMRFMRLLLSERQIHSWLALF